MDDEIESLTIGVRADTAGFAQDVAAMRTNLTDGLGGGADKAGQTIATALAKAAKTGSLSFDDLKATALKALDQIGAAAVTSGLSAALGGGSGIASVAGSLLTGLLGLPGRATGGAVSPGAAYVVGERGPELFVPTSSGSVVPSGSASGGNVRVAIAINAPTSREPQALARSTRQVARAVQRALGQGG